MKRPNKKSHYTITEAAKRLGITRIAVYQAIKQRRLEADWGTIERHVKVIKTKGYVISDKDLQNYAVSELHQSLGKKTIDCLTDSIKRLINSLSFSILPAS